MIFSGIEHESSRKVYGFPDLRILDKAPACKLFNVMRKDLSGTEHITLVYSDSISMCFGDKEILISELEELVMNSDKEK